MIVFDLINTSIHGFCAYKFRGVHDDDMSGHWVKKERIPRELIYTNLFGWEIIHNCLCMAVDDKMLEYILYNVDGGDGRQNQPIQV